MWQACGEAWVGGCRRGGPFERGWGWAKDGSCWARRNAFFSFYSLTTMGKCFYFFVTLFQFRNKRNKNTK
ncbi:hypothetical protein HanIR_Chr02g0086211 [Helianthus annuus]|nr:hypothetical protein HanIR_Chr02g0086211 [Helianthus annuus]